jgi:hypothetical protein
MMRSYISLRSVMPGSEPLYVIPMIARDNSAQEAIVNKEALSQDSSYKSYEVTTAIPDQA